MHILNVVGARPNYMKAAPVIKALSTRNGVRQTLVHTGQHYDASMSEVFFRQLEMPEPDINLEVGSGSHAAQTAQIMSRFEPVLLDKKPDMVLVYGDVNSTVAAALVCSKLLVPVGHVEAGLRSFDRRMPEEINRLLTDQVADLLFTPSVDADANLRREGIEESRIHLVGNVMIDTLVRLLPKADRLGTLDQLSLEGKSFALVTLHRPSNVDDPRLLREILGTLSDIARDLVVIFPVHPRTSRKIASLGVAELSPNLHLLEPAGYLEFLSLELKATLVITDSGGIQEETTFLGIPCLTVRANTERPVTVSLGTNVLVGTDMSRLQTEVNRILSGEWKKGRVPPLWDGRTSDRIASHLLGGPSRPGDFGKAAEA